MTIRKQILLAMVAAAMQATSLGGRVYRSRAASLSRTEGENGLIIRPSDENVSTVDDMSERDFNVQFIFLARGEIPDDFADQIIGEVHEELCADPSFGGLAAQLFESGTQWHFIEADNNLCEVEVRYRVRLYTPEDSLTRPLS